MLHLFTVLACVCGFIPNNYLIGIIGVRTGLLWGFGIALVGMSLTLCLDESYHLFLLGFVIKHVSLSSFHGSRGKFVNTFFKEKDKPIAFSLIMVCFPLGVGLSLSGLALNELTKDLLGKKMIVHIFSLKLLALIICTCIVYFGI